MTRRARVCAYPKCNAKLKARNVTGLCGKHLHAPDLCTCKSCLAGHKRRPPELKDRANPVVVPTHIWLATYDARPEQPPLKSKPTPISEDPFAPLTSDRILRRDTSNPANVARWAQRHGAKR